MNAMLLAVAIMAGLSIGVGRRAQRFLSDLPIVDDYYVEVPAAFIQLKPGATVTEEEIIAFCVGKIATFRVPRYVRFVTEWPMSGTKIKKAILREMIAADLKEKGISQAPKIETAPAG